MERIPIADGDIIARTMSPYTGNVNDKPAVRMVATQADLDEHTQRVQRIREGRETNKDVFDALRGKVLGINQIEYDGDKPTRVVVYIIVDNPPQKTGEPEWFGLLAAYITEEYFQKVDGNWRELRISDGPLP
jgi:hypothetical protein